MAASVARNSPSTTRNCCAATLSDRTASTARSIWRVATCSDTKPSPLWYRPVSSSPPAASANNSGDGGGTLGGKSSRAEGPAPRGEGCRGAGPVSPRGLPSPRARAVPTSGLGGLRRGEPDSRPGEGARWPSTRLSVPGTPALSLLSDQLDVLIEESIAERPRLSPAGGTPSGGPLACCSARAAFHLSFSIGVRSGGGSLGSRRPAAPAIAMTARSLTHALLMLALRSPRQRMRSFAPRPGGATSLVAVSAAAQRCRSPAAPMIASKLLTFTHSRRLVSPRLAASRDSTSDGPAAAAAAGAGAGGASTARGTTPPFASAAASPRAPVMKMSAFTLSSARRLCAARRCQAIACSLLMPGGAALGCGCGSGCGCGGAGGDGAGGDGAGAGADGGCAAACRFFQAINCILERPGGGAPPAGGGPGGARPPPGSGGGGISMQPKRWSRRPEQISVGGVGAGGSHGRFDRLRPCCRSGRDTGWPALFSHHPRGASPRFRSERR